MHFALFTLDQRLKNCITMQVFGFIFGKRSDDNDFVNKLSEIGEEIDFNNFFFLSFRVTTLKIIEKRLLLIIRGPRIYKK